MTAALPPPRSRHPASSSGQSRNAAAPTAVPAPSAPLRWAAASPTRRPVRSMRCVTPTAPIPDPSTNTASGNPADAVPPVNCRASSAPAVPPAARPTAPSNCATTSTRMVDRCSRSGDDIPPRSPERPGRVQHLSGADSPEGQRLLVRARELLALHDQTIQEVQDTHLGRPLLVDLLAEGHTPVRVLRAARNRVPGAELVARFHGA